MATFQINITDQKAAELKACAQARGLTVEQWFLQLAEQSTAVSLLEANAPDMAPVRRKHISEVIRDIWSDLPDEARAKLPLDGAAQVDHYVYGLPKREP